MTPQIYFYCQVKVYKLFIWELMNFKNILIAFASYNPTLPGTISIDPRFFNSTVDLILDGIINLVFDNTSPPISLKIFDDRGNIALSLQIDPLNSVINLKNDFDVRT